MDATWPCSWSVNIGPGNGRVLNHADTDVCRYMTSLGHNELTHIVLIMGMCVCDFSEIRWNQVLPYGYGAPRTKPGVAFMLLNANVSTHYHRKQGTYIILHGWRVFNSLNSKNRSWNDSLMNSVGYHAAMYLQNVQLNKLLISPEVSSVMTVF